MITYYFELEGLIEDELMNRLLSYVDHEFDREAKGKFGMYRQNCSSQQLGPTRIGASCDLNAQITLGRLLPDIIRRNSL